METSTFSCLGNWLVHPRRSYRASRRYHSPLEVQTQTEMPTTPTDASPRIEGALQLQVQRCLLSWTEQLTYCQSNARSH